MTITRAQPSAPLAIRAADWNAIAAHVEAAEPPADAAGLALALARCQWLWAKNGTSSTDFAAGDAVHITGPLYTRADRATEFTYRPAVTIEAQKAATPPDLVAVCLQPIKAGKFGRVALAGIVAAQITVNNNAHTLAAAGTSGTTLQSGHQGIAAILWKAGTSGTQWALLRLQAHTWLRLRGTAAADISSGGSGNVTISHTSPETLTAYNDHIGTEKVSNGKDVFLSYFAADGKWRIDAADCES
jgi:hypothetical protein